MRRIRLCNLRVVQEEEEMVEGKEVDNNSRSLSPSSSLNLLLLSTSINTSSIYPTNPLFLQSLSNNLSFLRLDLTSHPDRSLLVLR